MSSPNQAATSAVSATQPAHASTIPRGTPDGKGRIGDRHHRWRHPGTAHKYSKVEHPLIMQIRATRRAERLFACVVLLAGGDRVRLRVVERVPGGSRRCPVVRVYEKYM